MECAAAARVDVEKVATPPLSAAVPSVAPPSRNVTVPVADEGDTVAVKVTVCPMTDGLRLDVNAVLLFPLFTVWVSAPAGEVLPL